MCAVVFPQPAPTRASVDSRVMATSADGEGSGEGIDGAAAWERAERRMVELFSVGVVRRERAGGYLSSNPAALEILGLSRDADGGLVEDRSAQVLRADGSPCPLEEQPFQRAMRMCENQGPITLGLRRGALVTWAMHQVIVVLGGDGGLLGGVHSVLDITAWKDSADALKRSRDLMRKAQEIAHVGSWDWDIIADQVVWTDEMHRIFGVAPEQFDGSFEATVGRVHPEDAQRVSKETADALASGLPPQPMEYRVVWPNGQIRHVWAEGELIRDDEGRAIRLYGAVQDVTERRTAEEVHASLEAQLRQAQKMDSVGQLAGGVAHDFNNLLQVILGNADLGLALAGGDTSRTSEIFREVKRGAERAAELTQQLLAFSRRQVIRPVLLDLNQLVGGLLKMLRRLIGSDVEIVFDPRNGLASVDADPGGIEQIVVNLALNARDAMNGEGSITIETREEEASPRTMIGHDLTRTGRYVVLEVRDTGCGMKPEVRDRVFEPFFTTKETGRGTGLGLSVVYGIVRQHGGGVHVESTPGSGTSFEVWLPAAKGEPKSSTRESLLPPSGGGETILVVEDEEAVRKLAVNMLEGGGYNVLVAENGQRALDLFAEHTDAIDLTVLDVVMPGLTGRDVRDQILLTRPDAKIVFVSGYDLGAKEDLLPNPGEHLLHKPYSATKLLWKIRELLDS